MKPRIGILGAGSVGGSLGVRFVRSGLPVRFGVRRPADAAELIRRCGGKAEAVPVSEAAAWAEVAFLCVPAGAAAEAARAAGDLGGKVLVDCTNPVAWEDGPVLAPVRGGSVAALLAAEVPGARVVKGFNGFGAEIHLDPDLGGVPADVLLAGDDAAAKGIVSDVARLAGFRPIDAGPLRNAALLESLAILWIQLAVKGGLGRNFAFQALRRG